MFEVYYIVFLNVCNLFTNVYNKILVGAGVGVGVGGKGEEYICEFCVLFVAGWLWPTLGNVQATYSSSPLPIS